LRNVNRNEAKRPVTGSGKDPSDMQVRLETPTFGE
jgi:hypothetical protein